MASLSKTKSKAKDPKRQKDGWTVQFFRQDEHGKRHRHSVRLGAVSRAKAEGIRERIEMLNLATSSDYSWDAQIAAWVAKLSPTLHDKLAKVGLVPPRARAERATLGPFVAAYIARRANVKAGTAIVYGHVQRGLLAYFGPDKPLREIHRGDASDFRAWLALPKGEGDEQKPGLGENTIRRRCGVARQFFADALDRKLIDANPFAGMKDIAVRANRSRDYHLSREDAAKIIKACPDAQWKLLFALSRYGGLRCPSEHLALRWGDVNWEAGRITVPSPKTPHHGEAKASRLIPIFDELRPHLQAAWDEVTGAEDYDPQANPISQQWIITRYRDANQNLRTQFQRIITKAGLKAWPKLIHNLRATRQTELAESFPMHVVCEWIGNSQAVAQEHYLRVTEEHFAKASGGALQKALQSAPGSTPPEGTITRASIKTSSEVPSGPHWTDEHVSLAGLEPTTYGLKVRCSTD
jgi:integrase